MAITDRGVDVLNGLFQDHFRTASRPNLPLPCSIPDGAALAFQWAIYRPGNNAFGWIVSDDMDVYWSHF